MAIPTTYTGTNSGAAPVYGGSKALRASQQGIQNMLQGQKDYTKFMQKEEQQFIEGSTVDPIQVAAKNQMTAQANKIEEYQNKWADVYAERDGRLTAEDKAMMAADKQQLKAWQGTVQAEYNQYLGQVEQFNRDTHDFGYFQEQSEAYLQTGKLPSGGLLRARPYTSTEFNAQLGKLTSAYTQPNKTVDQIGGKNIYTTNWRWSENDAENEIKAKQAYAGFVQSDDMALRRLELDWDSLDETKKGYWLDQADANNDGVADPNERDNAIIMFGYNKSKDVLHRKKTEESISRGSGSNLTAKQKNQRMELQKRQPEYYMRNGYMGDNGYGWKPSRDGYSFIFGKELSQDEKRFPVPSDRIQLTKEEKDKGMVLASDINGSVEVEPVTVYPGSPGTSNDAEIKMMVPVYKREDAVTGRKIKRNLNKLFEQSGSNTVVNVEDGKRKVYTKVDGVIYRLSDKVQYTDHVASYDNVREHLIPYFDLMDEAVLYTDDNAPKQATTPESEPENEPDPVPGPWESLDADGDGGSTPNLFDPNYGGTNN